MTQSRRSAFTLSVFCATALIASLLLIQPAGAQTVNGASGSGTTSLTNKNCDYQGTVNNYPNSATRWAASVQVTCNMGGTYNQIRVCISQHGCGNWSSSRQSGGVTAGSASHFTDDIYGRLGPAGIAASVQFRCGGAANCGGGSPASNFIVDLDWGPTYFKQSEVLRYYEALGYEPSDYALSYWTGTAQASPYAFTQCNNDFVHASWGILTEGGSYDSWVHEHPQESPTSWRYRGWQDGIIRSVYEAVLDRPAAQNELDYWRTVVHQPRDAGHVIYYLLVGSNSEWQARISAGCSS